MSAAAEVIQKLHQLRAASRSEAGYWSRLCRALRPLARADAGLILAQDKEGNWQILGQDPEQDSHWSGTLGQVHAELGERALERGFAMFPMVDGRGQPRIIGAVQLHGVDSTVILLDIPGTEKAQLNELLLRIQAAAYVPPMTASAQPAVPSETEEPRDLLLDLIDLVASIMQEKRFPVAALSLVNGVVARFGVSQVALGWEVHGYVRTQAISHLDRFERKTEDTQNLEATFEEAVDQGIAILYPDDDDGTRVVRAHQKLRQTLGHDWICTLPLSFDQQDPQAALLLAGTDDERLSDAQLEYLQLGLGLLMPWFTDLKARDRWWWFRFGSWAANRLGRLIGPEQVGRKVVALLVAGVLAYLLLGSWDYRIEAPVLMTTDSTRLIGIPFDGYLSEVYFSAGDIVTQDVVLARMDTQNLLLEESDIRAEMRRFEAEGDLARAQGRLAELEIAAARREQALARLGRVQHYLQQSVLRAPFDGVLVEGERRDLLGAPVRSGDSVFRIARVENLYLTLSLPERDVRFLADAATGTAALLGRPDARIPFEVVMVIPRAEVRGEGGNHFVLKAQITEDHADWWRPGMTGVAKIDVERKRIIWILTRRGMDMLRMRLWW